MRRLPLPLRLAARQLRTGWATFLLGAAFLALPTTILVVVTIVAGSTEHPVVTAVVTTATAATLAFPLALAIVALVGANLLMAARRSERTFALLGSVGAPPGALFRIVSSTGLLSGITAAVVTVIVGVPAAWLSLGAIAPVDIGVVALLATAAVAIGWSASVVPGLVAAKVDAVRVLRGLPAPARGRWRTDRIGLVLTVIGFGALLLDTTGALLLRAVYTGQEQPAFWVGALSGVATAALGQLGILLVVVGVALAMPALFRMLSRRLGNSSLAARLAARDAERGWNRSVSAGVTVLVTTFAIGSYLALGAVSSSPEAHRWQLQEGQIAVSLIDPDYRGGLVDPHPIANIPAVEAALREAADPTELRTLEGVQGPFYGWPVEENEGYSGRQELVFPEGGLPHPRLADPDVCSVEQLPAWRCAPRHHYDTWYFPLSPDTPRIWVGDTADLRLVLGGDVDPETSDALARGEAIVFDPRYLSEDGTVTIDWAGEEFVPEDEPGEFLPAGPPLRSETIAGHLVPLDHALDYGVFLSRTAAADLGLDAQPSRLLGALPQPLTGDARTAVVEAVTDAVVPTTGNRDLWLNVMVESGPSKPAAAWIVGALLVAIGVGLAVSLVAVGLARIEGRVTDRTMAALGADPGIRRRISGWYALIVVGLPAVIGTVLAVVSTTLTTAGLGPVAAGLPWLELVLLAIGVPVLASLIALVPKPEPTWQRRPPRRR